MTTKTEVKHTPGPWKAILSCRESKVFSYCGKYAITEIARLDYKHCGPQSSAECDANALLIAAAPELLDALDIAIKVMEENHLPTITLKQIIAKAEGRD